MQTTAAIHGMLVKESNRREIPKIKAADIMTLDNPLTLFRAAK